MTTKDIHPLLDDLEDTREVVIRRVVEGDDGPIAIWRAAALDARSAYGAWCTAPGVPSHACYLAAEDQADAALASLHGHREPRERVTA
jgi:hypothetical protein